MKKAAFLLFVLAVASCCNCNDKPLPVNIIPEPASIELHGGCLDISDASIWIDPSFDAMSAKAVTCFYELLGKAAGKASMTDVQAGSEFQFVYDSSLAPEQYLLEINCRKAVIKASSLNGVVYAIESIKQMLPVSIYNASEASDEDVWALPCVSINDQPRFEYRGVHMDPCRHFWSIDEVKRYLDIATVHKINRLHWHLTEDQGWRMEVKKYPLLTEIGSKRPCSLVGHLLNGKEEKYDNVPVEGYYTQEQMREIVEYAAERGITVIPEIDLPGHMLAALAAYPELGCTGGPYEVWCKWGVSDQVLCVGREETMKFLEDVLDEVCEIFPSEYIHIGGDECPKTEWAKCPRCQAKIKELGLKGDDRFTAEQYLQSQYVTVRIENYLASKGRKIIGWDEILEGELSENATVMSWRGISGGIKAAQLGHDAIMTPYDYCYLDYYQSEDRENEPLSIGGYIPVEKVYGYEPYTEDMTDEQKSHILGVQGNLWTEYIATPEHLEYMLLPRLSALSEVQWCAADNKDYRRFLASMEHMRNIYEALGLNYADHIFRPECAEFIDPEAK